MLEFYPVWAKKRIELNIPLDSFVLISVGELNSNKNNIAAISAMQSLGRIDIQYVLCGTGKYEDLLYKQVDEAGLQGQVHFLGYRSDVKELYRMADCFIMPSFREGLSRSMMEAMASGLPCVVSKIRGNVDLIQDEGGFLCSPNDIEAFGSTISTLCEDENLCYNMGVFNKNKVKEFDVSVVSRELKKIYADI